MLGFSPLGSRPLGDTSAQTRLAALSVTEADDSLAASAALQINAQAKVTEADDIAAGAATVSRPSWPFAGYGGGGRVRRHKMKRTSHLPDKRIVPAIHAQVRATEDDDVVVSTAVIARPPNARQRRQAAEFLLL
jgi:hypothetical protein